MAIAAILLTSIASGSLDSGNTGLSPIPMDLKVSDSTAQTGDNQASASEGTGVEAVTNRKNPLSKNSSLQQVAHEDVMPAPRPNIIIMMADNMGYMDAGCYGGGDVLGAPTPGLDQMAREGLKLTSFYSETQCTPTRAAMMTGRLPIRVGMTLATEPGAMAGLSPQETTLAEVLSDAGYRTAMFGKWHLGDINESEPQNMGFDEFFGVLYHLNSYSQRQRIGFDPNWELDEPLGLVEAKRGENLTVVAPLNLSSLSIVDEQCSERAIAYIKDQADSSQPFFIYLPFVRTHFPSVQNPKWAGKSSKGPYGDGLMEMDSYVGEVLDALRETGIENNTIVVFTSDNGPTLDQWPDAGFSPFRGGIGTAYEGGVRVPCIFWWPGKIEAGRVSNEIMCTMDLFSTFSALGGGTVPSDRPIDGIDQSDFLLGIQNNSDREWLVWYIGIESAANTLPAAVRWHQFKIHFKAYDSFQGPESSYGQIPAVYNIEIDPREEHNIAGEHDFVINAAQMIYRQLVASMKQYPNTPSRAYSTATGAQ
ncbi:MAG TPA: arylsulfatase [Methanotrichaceae archaeon]|nr:arylsulfatase [Methanotrichaceae archaeon]HQF16344.1 arylsulfatase [Methanotrichaceae archaeon]HQI91042.1 arylsulfatase [Methanotrichaceae archaeon]